MAFSWTGLIMMLLIMLPSIAFALLFPPKNMPEKPGRPRMVFVILERVGQAGCVILSMFTELPIALSAWSALCLICLIVYYSLWIRYIAKGKDFKWLFAPFLGIPVPMAIFPVAAFGFAAVWGQSIWLGAASAVLATGHIAVSLNSYKSVG